MMLVPHRKHTYGYPGPVTEIALLFILSPNDGSRESFRSILTKEAMKYVYHASETFASLMTHEL
jgi:hypothetical protein